MENTDLIKLIMAVIFPPLGVALQVGLTPHFWINIVLTMFGWFPGVIHALYVILNFKDGEIKQ